jgi:hypothetical protein
LASIDRDAAGYSRRCIARNNLAPVNREGSIARQNSLALLGTLPQTDSRALTLQFAVRVVGWIEFQAAVLARDARIISGFGGLGDNASDPQGQKQDYRHN